MSLTNRSHKILKTIYKKPMHYGNFSKICDDDSYDELARAGMFVVEDLREQDSAGFPVGELPDDSLVFITTKGRAEIESKFWFTKEYVVSHIVIPIILSILTTLITISVTALLQIL